MPLVLVLLGISIVDIFFSLANGSCYISGA